LSAALSFRVIGRASAMMIGEVFHWYKEL
jgi:hypothetical protein